MIRCTHSLSAIAIALTSALSLNASATSEHGYFHGNEGIAHIKNELSVPLLPVPFTSKFPQKLAFAKAQGKTISMNSASSDQIIPETCEPSEFASYSGNDFVEYVSNAYLKHEVSAGYDCFRSIAVTFKEAAAVFSTENVNNVANAIVSELSEDSYVPERIFGKVFFLRVMYLYAANNDLTLSTDDSNIKAAFDDVFANFDGNTTDRTHQLVIAETINLAGGYYGYLIFKGLNGGDERAAKWIDLLPIMKSRLDIIRPLFTTPNEQDQYGIYHAVNTIINEFNRMTRYYIGEATYDDVEMPSILAQYIYNINVDDPVPSNAIHALLAMAEIGITNEIVAAVQEVLDAKGKFSQPHVALLRSISNSGLDCTVFERDSLLCVTDELIEEMRDFALPSEFTFGDITFKTKLSEERARHIYNSLQATRSLFFRNTGITDAVQDDPNEKSTFVIYGSPEDYQTFQGYLYGLDANNGGIYIEQDGTLYTFDRPDTEMFVLEELARHEYVHYLNSRYLVKGMWGETQMYENDRFVWFDEGMANYLAGAKQYGGTDPLATMIEMKSWHRERSISEITATSYSDDWMYPYSALLFNYLDETGSESIVDMASAVAADDVFEFDSIVASLSSLDSGFQTYISELTADGWQAPWYEYQTDALLEADGVVDIQTVLTASMGATTSCSELDASNFKCTFTIEANGAKAKQINIVNSVLDTGIEGALSNGLNNFETMTCHPTKFNTENVDAECIGLLRPDNIDYDEGVTDTDGDGYPDEQDAFPNDPTEWADTDGDGHGDNSDAFPSDPTEWVDSDSDGTGDNADAFPNDASETTDTDGDGYGDNSDVFPNDSTEWIDSDSDGTGDNADAFPNDASETTDTDGDGYGDNSDVFPNDSTEWIDSDSDGTGDNADAFPNDASESTDTDGDGYGDNSDAYPNDASKWQKETTQPVADTPKSSSGGSFGFISALLMIGMAILRRNKHS